MIQWWHMLGTMLGGSLVSGSRRDGPKRALADAKFVKPRAHLLQVASRCNSKHNGGVGPTKVASADATFVLIFCTLSPEAMTLVNVKLVCQLP